MAKRKTLRKPKSILKKAGPARAPTPRKDSVPRRQNTANDTRRKVHVAAIIDHSFIGLTEAEKIDLDLKDYGFNHINVPTVRTEIKLPRPKLPNKQPFIINTMELMQNKVFFLRSYFVIGAKDLIWNDFEKEKSKSEQAMLNEAANPNTLLPVSFRAQDCIRLLLCYAALFEKEDKWNVVNGDENSVYFRAEREMNMLNRNAIWEKLRVEIAEQLPGDKKMREKRAEHVLQAALKLAVDVDVDPGNKDENKDNSAVRNSAMAGEDVERIDQETQDEAVAYSSSSDYDSLDEDD